MTKACRGSPTAPLNPTHHAGRHPALAMESDFEGMMGMEGLMAGSPLDMNYEDDALPIFCATDEGDEELNSRNSLNSLDSDNETRSRRSSSCVLGTNSTPSFMNRTSGSAMGGSELNFDGSGGFIHLSSTSAQALSFGRDNPFTIEVWVKPSAPDVPIVGKYNTEVRGEYKIYIDQEMRIVFCRSFDYIVSTGKVSLNDWSHIAAVYDGSMLSIIMNGERDASPPVPSGECEPDITTVVHVGTWKLRDRLGKFFQGSIRELRFWASARSEQQVHSAMGGSGSEAEGAATELVGYWPMSEGGGRLIKDFAGENSGYLISDDKSGWVHPSNGAALELSANGGYIELPGSASNLSFAGDFSIEVWVRPYKADAPIVGKFNTNVKGEYKLYLDSECRPCFYREAAPYELLRADQTVPLNEWCHIAVTYDSEGERLNIYLMGQRSGSMSSQVAEGKVGTDQPVYIGTWHRDGKVGRKFSGMLRELRFWDSARTANQMVESMFGLSADELADDSLKGYWPLSGGTERYIVDLSKNRNHGMVRGDASWVWIDGEDGEDSAETSIKFGSTEIHCRGGEQQRKRRSSQQEQGMKRVLVTGGAGYIGSHVCLELLQAGYMVCVIDNYDNSSAESLNRVCSIVGKPIAYHRVDLLDEIALEEIFTGPPFEAVLHIAGLKSVSKSTGDPLLYYHNNVTGTLNLLSAMSRHKCKNLIFSSSATVYGNPEQLPVTEQATVGLGITNPYGQTKFMIEIILHDLANSDPEWKISMLRYFNPVGAHPSGLIGEDPTGPPNNLLPFITQVAVGRRAKLMVYGDDWPTKDGTGVRDYIHVVDLAKGHVAALEHLRVGCRAYNLGTGKGVSVLEMLRALESASGTTIAYEIADRRTGDIAAAYADPALAAKELEWKAELGLDRICEDAWRWQVTNPKGYGENMTGFTKAHQE